jgi:hypothetical protein
MTGGGTVVVSPLIQISSATGGGGLCPAIPAGTPNVCDLTVMNASASDGAQTPSPVTIQDQLTNTTLSAPNDSTVGTYILGEQVTTGASAPTYSRFTTSQSVPAWLSGSATPSGSCAVGSLYSCTTTSCTANGSPAVLYACLSNGTSTSWSVIK